jgi:hypothetical protein
MTEQLEQEIIFCLECFMHKPAAGSEIDRNKLVPRHVCADCVAKIVAKAAKLKAAK